MERTEITDSGTGICRLLFHNRGIDDKVHNGCVVPELRISLSLLFSLLGLAHDILSCLF